MTFEDAIKKMIRQYFAGLEPSEYKKTVGARKAKYGKKYFEDASAEFGLNKDGEDG